MGITAASETRELAPGRAQAVNDLTDEWQKASSPPRPRNTVVASPKEACKASAISLSSPRNSIITPRTVSTQSTEGSMPQEIKGYEPGSRWSRLE